MELELASRLQAAGTVTFCQAQRGRRILTMMVHILRIFLFSVQR